MINELKDAGTVFIVSHRKDLPISVDNVVTVVKDKDGKEKTVNIISLSNIEGLSDGGSDKLGYAGDVGSAKHNATTGTLNVVGAVTEDSDGNDIKNTKITNSCYIQNYSNYGFGTLTVDSNEKNVVIVMDNVTAQNDFKLVFNRHEELNQELEIIFKGDVNLDHVQIVPEFLTANGFSEIDYLNRTISCNDDWHITYYTLSENGEMVNISVRNPGLLFGSFKCPYGRFENHVFGYYDMMYEDKNGYITRTRPIIVGNAIFGEVDTLNGFEMIYTQSGKNNSYSSPYPMW